ncbi:hypothetical protein FACS189428_0530 [Clostridia bacterium]|nr:hypothetical protein FACS189428_0530 [Clostridia bacterium]
MAITNAADFDKIEGEPLRRVDEDIDALTSLGYEVTDVDLRQETQTSLAEKLPQYDAVFVSGGNTFWLLECMKKSGFTALIREFLKKGIYISTSAGSCVCAPNIEYVKYADDPSVASLSEYTGLNFVNVGIIPHFNAKK